MNALMRPLNDFFLYSALNVRLFYQCVPACREYMAECVAIAYTLFWHRIQCGGSRMARAVVCYMEYNGSVG